MAPAPVPPAVGKLVRAPEPPGIAPASSWQDAPPIRRPGGEEQKVDTVKSEHAEEAAAVRMRRRNLVSLGVVVVAVLGIVAGVIGSLVWYVSGQEDRLHADAQKAYAEGRFAEAAGKYEQLAKTFGTSPRVTEYQFFRDLGEVQGMFASPTSAPLAALSAATQFLEQHGEDHLLQTHGQEFGDAFAKWVEEKSEAVVKNRTPLPSAFIAKVRDLAVKAKAAGAAVLTPEQDNRIAQALRNCEGIQRELQERLLVLNELKKLTEHPSADAIQQARTLISQLARKQHGFDQDPEALQVVAQLYQGHAGSIHYTVSSQNLERRHLAEESQPGLLVDQLVQGLPPLRREGDPIVLALVRGVLYGLSQRNGEIVWAMRVGIDTSTLPVRLPAAGNRPEIVLALSADTETVTALDAATGDQLWKYRLSAPCLGQPVIVDLRAYIPTYDGWVHEIELAKGQLLGHYELGQHLTVGGTLQEGTKLVYFPAENQCVYVLDVANHRCEAILYSEHPSGSLRSAPIVTAAPRGRDEDAEATGPQGYLILSQTNGLDATALRAFALPIQPGQPNLQAVQTEPTRGWPWFQPYHDPEKLALVTDAGVVGLFGIRQVRNQDSVLFPLLREEIRVQGVLGADLTRPGRAQVVSCQNDDFWVLAHGGLQKLSLTMNAKGPHFAIDPRWLKPLRVGSPLHRSQTNAVGSTLFLVTQALARRACLATAVNAATKEVRWQRQVGFVCQGEPVVVGQEVFALDQGGGVFTFHPGSHPQRDDQQWQVGGQSLTKPLDDNPDVPPALYRGSDGTSAYEVACPGKGTQLVVRRFRVDEKGRRVAPLEQDQKIVNLEAPLAGNVAIRGNSMLVPLQDGTLLRLNLPPDSNPGRLGPDWRSNRRTSTALQGYVAWISDEAFLFTDGRHNLMRGVWPADKSWNVPDAPIELRARIVAPPVVLPRRNAQDELRVCVADADGGLTLLHGDHLEEVRHWDLGGKITAGPFLQDSALACVVDRQRLLWLDPQRKNPLWEYKSPGEHIVGQPQLIEDLLVVADQSGRFVGLDPKTGLPRGPGYTLKASVAPAASPVGFGPGWAFAPLTDGTVLLLSLQYLRDPLESIPILW